MPKTLTAGEAVAAELELLRAEDEARARRVRRIEALQLPILNEIADILKARPLGEAIPELEKRLPGLTDGRANAIANLIAHGNHVAQLIFAEQERISVLVYEDKEAAKAAD